MHPPSMLECADSWIIFDKTTRSQNWESCQHCLVQNYLDSVSRQRGTQASDMAFDILIRPSTLLTACNSHARRCKHTVRLVSVCKIHQIPGFSKCEEPTWNQCCLVFHKPRACNEGTVHLENWRVRSMSILAWSPLGTKIPGKAPAIGFLSAAGLEFHLGEPWWTRRFLPKSIFFWFEGPFTSPFASFPTSTLGLCPHLSEGKTKAS